MTRLTLLRHGDTGRRGHFDGRTDVPLSAEGLRQMERQTLGRRWPLIVTSPLQRARLPGERLAATMGARLIVDGAWAELDFGAWDGRARTDVESDAEDRERCAAFYRDPVACQPPGGESWTMLAGRVGGAVRRILSDPDVEDVLVIAHAGSIRAALLVLLGVPPSSLWAVRIDPGARLELDAGLDGQGAPWGQLVALVQAAMETD